MFFSPLFASTQVLKNKKERIFELKVQDDCGSFVKALYFLSHNLVPRKDLSDEEILEFWENTFDETSGLRDIYDAAVSLNFTQMYKLAKEYLGRKEHYEFIEKVYQPIFPDNFNFDSLNFVH